MKWREDREKLEERSGETVEEDFYFNVEALPDREGTTQCLPCSSIVT